MTDPRVLRTLELTVTRRLDGLLHGDYRGLLPGHGSEIGEARPYTPGDDVRRIDWSLTARTGQPHVRDTVVDRELETTLVVDLSASMAFGTDRQEKRDVALAIAGAFGFLVNRGGNRVGALLLSGAGNRWVPYRGGRGHLFGILGCIQEAPREGGAVDLAAGLHRANRLAGRRGLMIVISDFIGSDGWARPLQVLASRHEVIATEIVDRRELTLPAVGPLTVVDPETGRRRHVDTGRPSVRAAYAAAAKSQRTSIARAIARAGADHLRLDTSGDWLDELITHVFWRRRRREAAAGAPT